MPHDIAQSRFPRVGTPAAVPLLLLLALVGCRDEAASPTEAGPAPTLEAAATALAFSQVSGGGLHSCGLTTDSRAYCWGNNAHGALGTGSTTGPESCDGAAGPFACSTRPTPVAGSRLFRQVSTGDGHGCAIAMDFRAYCWGSNSLGQLGDGTRTQRLAPTLVRGGLRFYQVEAGLWHTCGVSYPDRKAYCWGYNEHGELGDGTVSQRLIPVPVVGNRTFRQVSAGNWHTCGVTTSNVAYCWGRDSDGQLGNDDVRASKAKPALVAGGHQFRQLAAGMNHTCAVTTADQAFCWGSGGQIGDGKTVDRYTPRAVAGGLSFSRVSTGLFHTCGETPTNRAYCWGSNGLGQLGNGGSTDALRPVAVAGGLTFAQLSAGSFHTCGKTPGSVAYCWGYGFFGQLGNGSSGGESRTPVAVAAPS